MNITLSKLKQLIKEELQKEATMDGSPPPRPAKNQEAAKDAIESVRTDVDGLIARLEDGIPPGPVQKAISKPLIDALDPIDDEILMQRVMKFRDDLHTIEKRRKGNAGILRQKWSQLQTAMLGMNEGKLSKKEKAYLLVDPSHLNEKGKKKKDHVDHK